MQNSNTSLKARLQRAVSALSQNGSNALNPSLNGTSPNEKRTTATDTPLVPDPVFGSISAMTYADLKKCSLIRLYTCEKMWRPLGYLTRALLVLLALLTVLNLWAAKDLSAKIFEVRTLDQMLKHACLVYKPRAQ